MTQNQLIDNTLKPLDGYLISIVRDTINGWYEIKFGIPASWVYDESNKDVACIVENSTDKGILLKVHPKKENVTIDDLIQFLQNLMKVNIVIQKKQDEFKERMKEHKSVIQEETDKFCELIDNLKLNAFNLEESDDSEDQEIKKTPEKTTTKKTSNHGRKPKTATSSK